MSSEGFTPEEIGENIWGTLQGLTPSERLRVVREQVRLADEQESPMERTDGKASLSNLGQAADLLSEQLRRAERLIREQGYGVFGSVPMPSDGWSLAFGKRHQQWSLYVVSATGEEVSLTSASIQHRHEAAKLIPALCIKLKQVHLAKCVDLQQDGVQLRNYLDQLEATRREEVRGADTQPPPPPVEEESAGA